MHACAAVHVSYAPGWVPLKSHRASDQPTSPRLLATSLRCASSSPAHARMCTAPHLRMHACAQLLTCACMHVHSSSPAHACMCVRTYAHVCMHVRTYAHVCLHVRTHAHVHVRTCMRTYACAHARMCMRACICICICACVLTAEMCRDGACPGAHEPPRLAACQPETVVRGQIRTAWH